MDYRVMPEYPVNIGENDKFLFRRWYKNPSNKTKIHEYYQDIHDMHEYIKDSDMKYWAAGEFEAQEMQQINARLFDGTVLRNYLKKFRIRIK